MAFLDVQISNINWVISLIFHQIGGGMQLSHLVSIIDFMQGYVAGSCVYQRWQSHSHWRKWIHQWLAFPETHPCTHTSEKQIYSMSCKEGVVIY